jgi:peroxiredoxin Q/BCP
MSLSPGDAAPDFSLVADDGGTVTLSELRGTSVVLYFYPKDDTSGCTKQACGFRDHVDEFADRGWMILGVSPDDTASHERFKSKYGLNFRLLSDPNHEVADAYGAWGAKKMYGREYEGILRSTFLIDAEGRIARIMEKVKPAGHAEALLETPA